MAFFFDDNVGTARWMEEEGRALLRSMLVASAGVTTVTSIIGSLASGRTEHLVPTLVMVSFQLLCWALVKKVKPKTVAVFYLLVVTILTVPISLLDRGVEGQAYYSLVMVQIIAALLFELRTALVFTGLAVLGGVPLIMAMQRNALINVPSRDPLLAWLVPVSAFVLVTIALSAVHKRLRNAVALAHENADRAAKVNEALQVENERRQLAETKALAGSHSKSAFLANVSHDLRTPMNAVVGLTDLLLRESELPAKHREHLETIRTSSEGLLRLLNDILDLSKIEAGSMTFERLPVRVSELIDGVRRLFQVAARDKGLSFLVDVGPEVPPALLVDPTRYKQVIVNLVGNAVKFTAHGEVRLRCSWANDRLTTEVHDTGIGIAAKNRDALFQAFSQADPSTTRRFGGTGLGLVIVARLCELMGGRVTVETELGRGSTFTAVIDAPRTDLPVPSEVSEYDQLPAIDPSTKILLAEDNPVNQKVALKLLERLGLKADIAENGKVAFDRSTLSEYDVILMDLQMPELDGLEAMRLIRTLTQRQPVIIALTANAMLEDERACRNAGADEFLTKPVKLHQLAHVIARHVNKKTPTKST